MHVPIIFNYTPGAIFCEFYNHWRRLQSLKTIPQPPKPSLQPPKPSLQPPKPSLQPPKPSPHALKRCLHALKRCLQPPKSSPHALKPSLQPPKPSPHALKHSLHAPKRDNKHWLKNNRQTLRAASHHWHAQGIFVLQISLLLVFKNIQSSKRASKSLEVASLVENSNRHISPSRWYATSTLFED